ncbi:hypothetical protein O7627_24320 [Solwaraspora sp. WMMD1047]|uniref:hypothetical protein n=1 Tax=Solwaraspora sp. WMMD1047 TaxID=3016102 RepID=UPI002415CD1C|nr:hypothetical protein [Solwaraspora sp. WMMD1047]MDG4832409.1 hypothetical protein [Solwaraspora sp. WMMD1047]
MTATEPGPPAAIFDRTAEAAARLRTTSEPGASLAARIHARLVAALTAQERGGFQVEQGIGVCSTDGTVRLTLADVARIAAQEAAEALVEP